MTEEIYRIIEPSNIRWLFNDLAENVSSLEIMSEFEKDMSIVEVENLKKHFDKAQKSLSLLENKIMGNIYATSKDTFEFTKERN